MFWCPKYHVVRTKPVPRPTLNDHWAMPSSFFLARPKPSLECFRSRSKSTALRVPPVIIFFYLVPLKFVTFQEFKFKSSFQIRVTASRLMNQTIRYLYRRVNNICVKELSNYFEGFKILIWGFWIQKLILTKISRGLKNWITSLPLRKPSRACKH